MRNRNPGNRKLERQLGKLAEQMILLVESNKEMRQEGAQAANQLLTQVAQGAQAVNQLQTQVAQGAQAVNQLQTQVAQGAQAVNQLQTQVKAINSNFGQLLRLGNEKFSEVQGELKAINSKVNDINSKGDDINSKLDRVLVQTSMGQVEDDEAKARLAKLEDNERLTKKRLQNVLPFSGIERGLQNVAPGDPVKKKEAQASWAQFNLPPSPPRVERAQAVRTVRAASYATKMRR